jgi:nucleotide-binding universal stress UspA family protein
LVPTDFSKASLATIEMASRFSKRFGAELHLVHVFEPDYSIAGLVAAPMIVPEVDVRRRVRRHLQVVAKRHGVELRPENIHALRGRPFEEICRLARESKADLIIASTRGNTGFKHLALGSTAERIVRYAPCPVLVLPATAQRRSMRRQEKSGRSALSFETILVPIDFSDCSRQGLAYAKSLAKRFGSKLVLLHAVALQYYITNDEYGRYDLPLLLQQTEDAAREQMRDVVRKENWDGIKVEAAIQIGHAGEQVCARAEEFGADAIVTSTHGTTGLKHVLLGSTAEYIVRHAQRPVFVIPTRDLSKLNGEAA